MSKIGNIFGGNKRYTAKERTGIIALSIVCILSIVSIVFSGVGEERFRGKKAESRENIEVIPLPSDTSDCVSSKPAKTSGKKRSAKKRKGKRNNSTTPEAPQREWLDEDL